MKKALSVILSVLMLVSVLGGMNITSFASNTVARVTLGIDAKPFAGGRVDFNAIDCEKNGEYYIDTENTGGDYINGVKWRDERSGMYLTEGDRFQLDRIYTLFVRVKCNDGYKFYVDDATGECNVYCSVLTDCFQFGELKAEAVHVDGGFLEDTFDVMLTFDICSSNTTLDSVSCYGVDVPRPGATPNFICPAVTTTGASPNRAKDDVITGTGKLIWIDNGRTMTETDKFEQGKKYTARFNIKADDGYVFKTQADGSTDVKVEFLRLDGNFVNGYARNTDYYHGTRAFQKDNQKYLTVSVEYECTEEINSLKVFLNEEYAIDNQWPSFTSSTADGANYEPFFFNGEHCYGGVWCFDNYTHQYLDKNDTYTVGHTYTVTAAFYAKNGYSFRFPDYVKATFNGKEATVSRYAPVGTGRNWNIDDKIIFVTFELGKAGYSIMNADIAPFPRNITYTGSEIIEPVKLTNNDTELVEGRDYTVTYSNNINAGTAQVHVEGKGDYVGAYVTGYYIAPKKITPTVSLSSSRLVYNGRSRKPTLTVYDGTKKLTSDKDYTVKWSSSASKNVGVYTATVTLKGNYQGSKAVKYEIVPQGTSFKADKITKKNSVTLYFNKQKTQTTGYEIQYATNSKFTKNAKSVKFTNLNATSRTITGLKKNTKYYFRIRTYKKVKSGTKTVNVYSDWSKSRTATTKKK